MMNRKFIAGIIVFGSLWGFAECIIGSLLRDVNLPAGAIMTGIFAIGLMTLSRSSFKQPGMQTGIGLVAGALRFFNPFGGCFICSAIAIMAEGLLFDLIWTGFSLDLKKTQTITIQASLGITSTYLIYIGGYIITQILTPVFSSAGFYLENLIVFIPQILACGLLAALLGVATVPIVFSLKKLNIALQDPLYYPVTIGTSMFCWMFVIVNTIFILGI
ncbi:hypothetical protein AYK25_04740 [Thermoplasmatales archaeon SM1-50]|nr:MAG: hypothetical protein AYK25_04740 [Thermoplasmatales archaeon SM1-50]